MVIYCINLEHRKDRKIHSLYQFTKMDIPHESIIYPHFTKDKRGGVYGCFDSHMKIWNHFYTNFPNEKFFLVFEDDFVSSPNSKYIIKMATNFLEKNYNDIDIIFLHDMCMRTDDNINNNLFTSGYGFLTHAMIVTRHYIENIMTKYGNLPEPNGQHIDQEISISKYSVLYSNKLFYTKKKYFTQLIGISDNYSSRFDEFCRKHNIFTVESITKFTFKTLTPLRKMKIMNDDQIKKHLFKRLKMIS